MASGIGYRRLSQEQRGHGEYHGAVGALIGKDIQETHTRIEATGYVRVECLQQHNIGR
jgi:hypothetical protein